MVGAMRRQKSLKEGGALLQMSGRKTCRQTQSLGTGLAWCGMSRPVVGGTGLGTKSLVEANDTYRISIVLAGAEQIQPLVSQGAVVTTAGWCLFTAQGADCDGEGVLSEGAVLVVVFTEALAVFAEFLDAFQGGMDHIVDLRAVPVLQFASHVGHEAVTVSLETLWVVNHGVVNM